MQASVKIQSEVCRWWSPSSKSLNLNWSWLYGKTRLVDLHFYVSWKEVGLRYKKRLKNSVRPVQYIAVTQDTLSPGSCPLSILISVILAGWFKGLSLLKLGKRLVFKQLFLLSKCCKTGFHCTFLNFYFHIMTVKPNTIPCRRHPFCSRLISNNRVTAVDHWQDVRLVQFDIKGSGMRYSTLCTPNKIVDTSRFSIPERKDN